jgi:hypothetical protein
MNLLRRLRVVVAALLLAGPPVFADVVKVGMTLPLTGVQKGNGTETEQVWRAFGKYAADNKLLKAH